MLTSYAQIAGRGGTSTPGGYRRNGLPMDRPYLSLSQRAVLAVVARAGRARVADLPERLGLPAEDVRPAVASLALCGLLLVDERPGSVSLMLTGNGRRLAADLRAASAGRWTR